MNETPQHVDELTMMRLADRELSEDREPATREHLIACASCRSAYEALKAETQLIRAAVIEQDEALPDHIRPRQTDVSWLLVAVIILATLGVSSLWTRFVSPVVDGIENAGVDGATVATSVIVRSLLWDGWTEMLMNLLDATVLLVVLSIAAYTLRRAWRRLRSTATFSVLLLPLFLLSSPGRAHAAVIELDAERYTLPAGDTVDNDLIIAARTVRIDGTVTGDLIVFAGSVQITGDVQGDLLGFAERVEVNGRIGGNVRIGARHLEIQGRVARNITAGGESVRLLPGASVEGSFTAGAGEIIIETAIPKDIITAAGRTELHAPVTGSALMAGDRLTVGPSGGIAGDARFFGVNEPEVDPDAVLASPIDFERIEDEPEDPRLARIMALFYFWTAAFIFGAVVMLVTPEATEAIITQNVPDIAKSLASGVLSSAVLGAIGLAAVATVVGAPLGATAFFILGMGLYFAQVYVAAYIGREILGTPTSAAAGLLRLALGLAIIYVAKGIPILSGVTIAVVALWGFGALSNFVHKRLRAPTPTPSAAEPVEA